MKRSIIVAAAVVLALAASLWSQEPAKEWKIRVKANSAEIHRSRDTTSPVIAWSPKGSEFKSSLYDGEWYMITVATGQGGQVLPGYISRFDVDVIEEKTEKTPGYFDESVDAFKGGRLTIKLTGGWGLFGSGDFDPAAKGMFNKCLDLTSSLGYTIQSTDLKSFTAGPEGGADLIFRMSPTFSIGVGGSYLKAKADSSIHFAESSLYFQTLWNTPAVTAYSFRVEAYYDIPLRPWLGLSLHGGPAFFHASYSYSRDYFTSTFEDEDYQSATGNTLGLHGGVSLAVSLNSQVAFIVEARARYARFTNLTGSEKTMYTVTTTDTVETTGSLYNITGEKYARIAVLTDAAAAGLNAQKAVFDFSGVSLLGGVLIRF
jgi:hypothetical protein